MDNGLVRLARRHLVLLIALAVVGAVLGTCAALFVVPATYTAETKLYVSGQGSDPDARLQNGEYARTHVSSYVDMAASDEMLQAVRQRLGVSQTTATGYADLATQITATNPLETLIIDVSVESRSPQQAVAVARAIGDVYDTVVAQAETNGSGNSPVRVTVLSPPGTSAPRTGPNVLVFAAGGLVVGAAVGVLAALLVERRAARVRPATVRPVVDWSWEDGAGTSITASDRDAPVDLTQRRLRADHDASGSATAREEHGVARR